MSIWPLTPGELFNHWLKSKTRHMGQKPLGSCTLWFLFGVNRPSSFRDMVDQSFWPFDLWWPWPLTLTSQNRTWVVFPQDTNLDQIWWSQVKSFGRYAVDKPQYSDSPWKVTTAKMTVQKNTKSCITRKRCIVRKKLWATFLCASLRRTQWSLFRVDTINTFWDMVENVDLTFDPRRAFLPEVENEGHPVIALC